jgi:hypothetical protein
MFSTTLQDLSHSYIYYVMCWTLLLYVISGWLKKNVEWTIHYSSPTKTFGSLTRRVNSSYSLPFIPGWWNCCCISYVSCV